MNYRESIVKRGFVADAVTHVLLHASMTGNGGGKSSSSSSSSSSNKMNRAVVRMSMFTMFSLLLLAQPNDAVTKIARISMRPRTQTYTIDVTEFDNDDNSNNSNNVNGNNSNDGDNSSSSSSSTLKIDVRQPLIHQIYCRQTKPLFGYSDVVDKDLCSAKTPTGLSHLTQSFKEVFMTAGRHGNNYNNNNNNNRHQKRTKRQQHQQHHNMNDRTTTTTNNNNGPNTSQVHVGKMLSAMQEMEEHMRSVGMTQTANDLKGNIEKATRLYKSAPAETRDSLPDLLKWEVETGIHGERKSEHEPLRVKNHSGAMGLFWIAHNVEYQNDLYRQMLDEDKTPLEAAHSAFEHTLEPHMEWATKKVARAAIPRMVPATKDEFFSALSGYPDTESYGPTEHEVVSRDVHQILDVWEPIVDDWKQTFDQLQLTDI